MSSPAARTRAKATVAKFAAKTGGGVFSAISRGDVANGLTRRVDYPGDIDQGSSSLCGPSALLFNVARDNPEKYVGFVTDLYDRGRATLGKLTIEPGTDLKAYAPNKSDIAPVDWIALASIRDSENWFFDYQSTQDEFAGITMPSALEDWFKKAGYRDVKNETNIFFTKGQDNARKASDLFKKGYKVSLFINALMLTSSKHTEDSWTPDHWVVLNSTITMTAKSVLFKIYTWGNPSRAVPYKGTLSQEDFLDNYYGFVACKL